MYVSYDQFLNHTLGGIPSHPIEDGNPSEFDGISERDFVRIAPIADLIIDDWTLGRVGKAVKNGEELPNTVLTVYTSICEALPAIMEGQKNAGGLVSSFSNGVDSYTFAVTSDVAESVNNQVGWLRNLLPVEWGSACVYFEGGNEYAR